MNAGEFLFAHDGSGKNILRYIPGTLGATTTDVQSEINDFNPGLYITFGRFDPAHSNDDWFHSELLLIWANNPAYGSLPWYHFLAEARYNGSDVVTIAPDYSPSAIHADYHLPVRPGTDAAWALAMCKVIIDEGIYDSLFVKDQTDLPLLVRTDTGEFLRQSHLESDGRADRFFQAHRERGVVPADPASLHLDFEPLAEKTVYFTTDSDRLSRATRRLLEDVARDYRKRRNFRIVLGGHAEKE